MSRALVLSDEDQSLARQTQFRSLLLQVASSDTNSKIVRGNIPYLLQMLQTCFRLLSKANATIPTRLIYQVPQFEIAVRPLDVGDPAPFLIQIDYH